MTLKLKDFFYHLPNSQIAKHPLENRDESKLLLYKNGEIHHQLFKEIPELLPSSSTLVFNNTKVIPARLFFYKPTGAKIEIFLLAPYNPPTHEEAMLQKKQCSWKCLIGNSKRWGDYPLKSESGLTAKKEKDNIVHFTWTKENRCFGEMIEEIGHIPLPPYIDREDTSDDIDRYQTVFSKHEGAVASPTASLHFSDDVIQQIERKKINTQYVTLHVSAGTFQPIKTDDVLNHQMHSEQIIIPLTTVETLYNNATNLVIASGTTALRTIESLYWYGVKLSGGEKKFSISQKDPYTLTPIHKKDALENILTYMEKHQLSSLRGNTEIFIYPSYIFQMTDALLTNYHLPGSSLILLVAAFVGDDWKNIYTEALSQQYRFLSYGDTSLLFLNKD